MTAHNPMGGNCVTPSNTKTGLSRCDSCARPVREQIAEAANRDAPKEACGFVLTSGAVVWCTNVDDAPWYRFRIAPDEAEAWWKTGWVTAVWHSHPTGPAVPSEIDIEQAVGGIEFLVYSVEDEDLATYRVSDGALVLVGMEGPE